MKIPVSNKVEHKDRYPQLSSDLYTQAMACAPHVCAHTYYIMIHHASTHTKS